MKLKTNVDNSYYGLMLSEIYDLVITPKELRETWSNKLLKTVPHKVTAFFERSSIKEVFKISEYKYYVIDSNDKVYELAY